MKNKVTLDYLPYKAIPTWRVKQGESEWFFTANNGSVFHPPEIRAKTLYNRLKTKSEADIEDLGNNNWMIDGEKIYAPNIDTAIKRYLAKERS